jgi:hypothetical protein
VNEKEKKVHRRGAEITEKKPFRKKRRKFTAEAQRSQRRNLLGRREESSPQRRRGRREEIFLEEEKKVKVRSSALLKNWKHDDWRVRGSVPLR